MPSKYKKKKPILPKRIFICCEDTVREPKYFKEYVNFYRIDESQVKLIERDDTASSPTRIYQRVLEFIDELKADDDYYGTEEFWVVIDVDRWGVHLSKVTFECNQRGIQCSISNPCFEIWLLCHYKSAQEIDINPCKYNKQEINAALNEYNLSGRNERDYFPRTDRAIKLAEKLDLNRQDRWPPQTGTRVYLLMKELKSLIRQ